MLIILALIAILLLVFASCVREAESAIAAIAMPVPAVEIFIGGKNVTCRRIAGTICAVGAVNRQQTAAPPE